MERVYLFDEAAEICRKHARPLSVEVLPVDQARGRLAAEDIIAKVDVPPFRRAMMDGFAVQWQDAEQVGTVLDVIGTVAAGDGNTLHVARGQAARIMTGAPVPEGADSVVRFEWCEEQGANKVKILRPAKRGESVQPIGEDGRSGVVILDKGTRLGPTEVAVCRTFGVFSVTVTQPPSVTVIVTGSELVASPLPLKAGQIYGANDAFLTGSLEMDGAKIQAVHYVADHPELIEQTIKEAVNDSDYVILTGGVSAGDFDYVPNVLRKLGGELALQKVLMRPGSPFVLTTIGSTTVFALSGNPAAGFVQFECFVRPTVRASLGYQLPIFPASGKLRHALELKPIKHVRIFRAKATVEDGVIWIDTDMAQSSGVVSSFAYANCLVRLDESSLPAGAVVPLKWFKSLI